MQSSTCVNGASHTSTLHSHEWSFVCVHPPLARKTPFTAATHHTGPGHQAGKVGDHCARVCLAFPSITGVNNSEQAHWTEFYRCNKNAELFILCRSYHHSGGNLGIYLHSAIISPLFLCQYCSRKYL